MTTQNRYLTHCFRSANLTTSLRIDENGDVALMQLDSRGDIATDIESTLPPEVASDLVDRAFHLPRDLESRGSNALSTGKGAAMPRPRIAESMEALELIREIRALTPAILANPTREAVLAEDFGQSATLYRPSDREHASTWKTGFVLFEVAFWVILGILGG